jgi:hypothetical protein
MARPFGRLGLNSNSHGRATEVTTAAPGAAAGFSSENES